ncbi:MAG TPA: NAD(P)/FAD-dependent oxidoreductase [Solirubrobacterales bacterium]|nr:NAD(P)/FAD-dependent oxidoreductase [Solirubrobacterales bacterium]
MSTDWECVVIGGGVAGLSSALVLGRARRRTLVLDLGGQSNRPAAHVGGLLGQEGTAPGELYAHAREQLARYDAVVVRDAEAIDARPEDDAFLVVLANGDGEVTTRTLILATGMDYELPALPGFREHWGGAVFHCPFCHGWEVRDRPLVVCGERPTAERQAALLSAWSDDVTVVEPGEVAGLKVEDEAVRAVVRQDGSEVACEAVLVHAPLRPRGRLPERLGLALNDHGLVEVDAQARTSVPGVYAAGDVAVAPQQVAVAMGSGHLAGVAAVRELVLGRS